MATPFDKQPPALNPKRNTFDLSFANNLTMPIGKLIPVFCKEVLPGDSFKIETNFGIRFQPMTFPVQTRMRADIHFFYVRNRNLWDNWKKFIGRTDSDVTFPTIADKPIGSEFYNQGSLADYLGIPTNYASTTSEEITFQNSSFSNLSSFDSVQSFLDHGVKIVDSEIIELAIQNDTAAVNTNSFSADSILYSFGLLPNNTIIKSFSFSSTEYSSTLQYNLMQPQDLVFYRKNSLGLFDFVGLIRKGQNKILTSKGWKSYNERIGIDITKTLGNNVYIAGLAPFGAEQLQSLISFYELKNINKPIDIANLWNLELIRSQEVSIVDRAIATFKQNVTPLSALPFRCYQYIYNAWYRNQQVDPLIIDGKEEYDIFLENMKDGADDFPYELHERYWERDVFTTSLRTPQMGTTPLVGARIDNPAIITQEMQTSQGNLTINTNQDGKVIGINHYDVDLPFSSVEALNEAINFGISINDFRNVNALQEWLEINIRRGYRYKEQILSHFGVNVKFEELNMPEFIGAVTQDVNTSTIYNQSSSNGGILGDFAGVATALGESKHKVSKYCDEHGFIMGIMSISPIPTYPQMLPKHFTKLDTFDYYFPEFAHIGLQPIPIKEIAPLQVPADAVKQNETFGYQRAWYDYVGNFDEVHGEFRGTLKNYLITRLFDTPPVLDGEFLKIKEEDVNDVFAYTQSTDKVLGQIYFRVKAKRPIPFFGTPRLT